MIRLIAALIALPSFAAAQEAWVGDWSFDPEWCAQAANIGSVSPAPIRFTQTEMIGYENTCQISGAEGLNLNAWMLTLTCQSEGSTYDEQRLIMVNADDMWMWFGSDAPMKFGRCGS